MAREKVTLTLDRAKANKARTLVGAASTSDVVDIALDHLLRAERLRSDIEAYRRTPPTAEEIGLAASVDFSGLQDDTDWAALYAADEA